MGEGFSVVPSALNTFGGYCGELGGGAAKTTRFVRQYTEPRSGDFTGLILPSLVGPLNDLRDSTMARYSTMEKDLTDTGANITNASWLYLSQDSKNANDLSGGAGAAPASAAAPGLQLGAPSDLGLKPPPEPEVDVKSIAEAAADWLADANDVIIKLTGWDPIGEALHKIAGNWMALKSIGAAYDSAGNAMEKLSGDLSKGSGQLDPVWNGRAALEFNQYTTNLGRGLEWEASVGRLVNRGLSMAADELNKAAIEAVRLIKEGLSRLVKVDSFVGILKLAAKFVPYAGQAATGAQIIQLLNEVRDHVMPMIDEIQRGVDAFKEFLAFVKDPAGAAKGEAQKSIDDRLAPYRERLEKGKEDAQGLKDVATAADVTRYTERPNAGYDVGDPNRMREDG